MKKKLHSDYSLFKNLFTDSLWTIDTKDHSKPFAGLVRLTKLVRTTIGTFAENRMGFQCVALSYFVTLATIPFCALIFTVSGGLGLSDKISDMLHKVITTNPELVDMILEKANNIIDIAKSGGVGIVSALFFFWTIIWLMFQVERVFNNVWGIRKIPRKIYKRFGFYLILMFLTPFVVVIFAAGIIYYSNFTSLIGLDLSEVPFLPEFLGYLVFYLITTFTLSAMYKFIPAARVKYRYALKSAFMTAMVFVAFQSLYLETQVFVARMNTVYGVIAAIPLFLIWLNFSWQIIIYGAELSYSFHKVDHQLVNKDSI